MPGNPRFRAPMIGNMLLITGASGRIGRRTAELLAGSGAHLRLMTRTPGQAPEFPQAEIIYGDFAQPPTLDAAFAGVSTALIVSGSAEPGARAELHRNAFQAAARARVRHVIYLSLVGSAPDSKYPFSRDHYQSEQFLRETGVPFTVLRNAFYMDMFPGMFDAAGVMRGPADGGKGAFVSREDCARVAAAALSSPPGGIHEITGPEAMDLAEVARRFSRLVGGKLLYEEETAEAGREWRTRLNEPHWRVELSLGWFQAIAAGELERPTDAVLRFTGKQPLQMEDYFSANPRLLDSLRRRAR